MVCYALTARLAVCDFLSYEQAARYGAFVLDPTPEELERFFFLDGPALEAVRSKRRRDNRLGWSIKWRTVRMLGALLTESDPVGVPQLALRTPFLLTPGVWGTHFSPNRRCQFWTTSLRLDGANWRSGGFGPQPNGTSAMRGALQGV
jgi:hypothetical protein